MEHRYHKLMLKGVTMEPSACTCPTTQWAALLPQRTEASKKQPYMIVIMIPSTKQLKISTDYLPPISSLSLQDNMLGYGPFKVTKLRPYFSVQSIQSLSRVRLFATPQIAACQASLSITNPQSLPKLMSIESVMPSSHLLFCHPLLLLRPIPPSIRVFSNQSTLRMRWPKYILEFKFSYLLPNLSSILCFIHKKGNLLLRKH